MKKGDKSPISNRAFDAQFLSIAPHYKPLLLDDCIVSIDSLRIKFCYRNNVYYHDSKRSVDPIKYLYDKFNSAGMFCARDWDIETIEHHFKLGCYRWTIKFTCKHCSFAVLLGRYDSNSGPKLVAPEAIFDFNPNKVPEDIWSYVFLVLLEYASQSPEIRRYDLATDYPVTRSSLELAQRPGSQHKRYTSPSGAVTEYIGERSTHGAVKLYDKAAEVKEETGAVSDVPMTRLELTLDPEKYKGILKHFPQIIQLVPMQQDFAFQKLPFAVKAVILFPALLPVLKSSVSRNTFAKYNDQIKDFGKTYYTLSDVNASRIDDYVKEYLSAFTSPDYKALMAMTQSCEGWVERYGLNAV